MKLRSLSVLTALLSLASVSRVHSASFYDLGLLPGGSLSFAYAVSDTGLTGGGGGNTSGSGFAPWVWRPGAGMSAVPMLPGCPEGSVQGVSGNGSVLVGYNWHPTGHNRAFRWTQAAGTVGLGTFVTDGNSYADGVSADGSVVSGYASDETGYDQAFRWTQSGGLQRLGKLPGAIYSDGLGMSRDGQVVVGESGPWAGGQAFRWTQTGGILGLGYLGTDGVSQALAASGDGSVVVGNSFSQAVGARAFRWTAAGGMVALGPLDIESEANGVSADGSIVVGSSRNNGAFIWDAAQGMRSLKSVLEEQGLSLAGWDLSQAHAISADGTTIIGYGIAPSGWTEAWIAVIPEPRAASLLVLTAPLLLWHLGRGKGKLKWLGL